MPTTPQCPVLETVAIGQELEPLTRGPLLPPHVMRWSAATENWHRIHYDQPYALSHEGLPGLLVNGSWKQHFVVQVLRRWAGTSG
jgi:hydroxyacyl-ACP dehydratase HTD2-like protein with hotdog domain